MHGQQGFCPGGEVPLGILGGEVAGGRVRVGEYRFGTQVHHRVGGGDKAVGRHDHLVAGHYAQGPEPNHEGIVPVAGTRHEAAAEVGG